MANTLKKYEGVEVVGTPIRVVKAGDGLSTALDIDPVEIKIGDTGYLVLQWECTDITYKRAKPGIPLLNRRHTLTTLRAMMIDGTAVAAELDARDSMLAEHAEKLRREQEAYDQEQIDFGR